MDPDTKHPAGAADTSRLHELHALGQSVWLDYIRRGILDNGELEEMIRRYDLRGVTSNPSIFEQAIGDSDDYDDAFDFLAGDGADANEAYEALAVEDITRACDLFRPVYDEAGRADGFVSLEVSPELAHDEAGTLAEARRLWQAVGRPNLMIKVPGTDAGLPVIEQLLSEGVNVNITLLFAVQNHERVMEAFLRGLERRLGAGEPVDHVASVASFFVSRVDSAVDAQLEKVAEAAADEAAKQHALSLRGKAAVANAKLAYQRFQQIFSGERWERLAAAGAQVQRPLWASTSTKNPDYRDVVYVEELIGPHTVNTMPLATIEAFADHGVARRMVDQDVEGARAHLAALAELGIDMDQVTDQLQREGVEKFARSFRELLQSVDAKLTRVGQT
ncbi:MAG TPA: transaldolase [Longimicrobium sp.]|nr:transaldolase [Longimicrobium sp.]